MGWLVWIQCGLCKRCQRASRLCADDDPDIHLYRCTNMAVHRVVLFKAALRIGYYQWSCSWPRGKLPM